MLLLSLSLIVSTNVLADELIVLLYGNEFQKSAQILKIHIWATLFIFLRGVLSKWLVIEENLKFSLISHLTGAIINIALNYFLIPKYGGLGAAWATIVACAFSGYICLAFSRRTYPMLKIMSKSFFYPLFLIPSMLLKARKGGI